uniref:Uncharacterized protein n=1 Tax=Lotus japonicus TaxID=34305 RepID=I3SG54_LOTJA|nr:unknown [Lotus japonicus]
MAHLQKEMLFRLITRGFLQGSMVSREIMMPSLVSRVLLFRKMFLMRLLRKIWVMSFSNRRSLRKLLTATQGALLYLQQL